MRYVKQIGIILGITLAGEILNHVVPLPVPAVGWREWIAMGW